MFNKQSSFVFAACYENSRLFFSDSAGLVFSF